MATDVKGTVSSGWQPLNPNWKPAIDYPLTHDILYDIVRALMSAMSPTTTELSTLTIVTSFGNGTINITRSIEGYKIIIWRKKLSISTNIYPDISTALLVIKENTKEQHLTELHTRETSMQGRQVRGIVYRDLGMDDPSLYASNQRSPEILILSREQPSIITNKIPIDSKGEYHGIEERFFLTLDDKPANYRYWLHNKEVTLHEYIKYIIKEVEKGALLIPDVAAIAGSYLLSGK